MLFKDYANRPTRIGISDEKRDKTTYVIYASGRQRERATKQRRRGRRGRGGHRRRVGGVEKSLGGELQRGGYLLGGGTEQ